MKTAKNYNKFKFTFHHIIMCVAIAIVSGAAIGYTFYRSLLLSGVVSIVMLAVVPVFWSKHQIDKQKNELLLQFKEGLYSLSTAIGSGKSIENSFADAVAELRVLYGTGNVYIIEEFELISKKLSLNEPVEDAMQDFAARSGLEDVQTFADVFSTCKRTGGNLMEVIKNASNTISDKITVEQEIRTLVAEKRMERNIMTFMPFVFILIMGFMAGDMLEMLYTTSWGRIVMTCVIGILGLSVVLSNKILKIEV